MKRLYKWIVCVLWEGHHEYNDYPGGYSECEHCKAWKDTWI